MASAFRRQDRRVCASIASQTLQNPNNFPGREKNLPRCHPEPALAVRDLHFAVVGAGVYDRPGLALGLRP